MGQAKPILEHRARRRNRGRRRQLREATLGRRVGGVHCERLLKIGAGASEIAKVLSGGAAVDEIGGPLGLERDRPVKIRQCAAQAAELRLCHAASVPIRGQGSVPRDGLGVVGHRGRVVFELETRRRPGARGLGRGRVDLQGPIGILQRGLTLIAMQSEQSAIGPRAVVIGIELDRLLVVLERPGNVSRPVARRAPSVPGFRVLRLKHERLVEVGDCALEVPQPVPSPAAFAPRLEQAGVELDRPVICGAGIHPPTLCLEGQTFVKGGLGRRWTSVHLDAGEQRPTDHEKAAHRAWHLTAVGAARSREGRAAGQWGSGFARDPRPRT